MFTDMLVTIYGLTCTMHPDMSVTMGTHPSPMYKKYFVWANSCIGALVR